MKLVKHPNEILRTECEKVKNFDKTLDYYLNEMSKAMILNGGIGLAANQIGINARMFVMLPTYKESSGAEMHMEFVNPEIVERSEEKADLLESCLSCPNKMIKASDRANRVLLKYQDREGKEQEMSFDGIDAVCVQHEVDHLNGVLILDKEAK